ncbi:predicted protein [Lichtheimia corymbifera JMRC:FSU:9682]|uniref:Uncharacterized protein n=1 Tax=Lichtheimia corymbifera JMRC:FSU:9682 TaxID=1263082 RepID=A0A068RPZ8_9FUNG|nr:predicted protein [Lichtheimia corymbifera JMRC:FSU:9682]
MRTMLISMTESTSSPSFDVPTSNIGAHGRTPYLCYHPFVVSPTFNVFIMNSGVFMRTKLLGVVERMLCESFRFEVGNLGEQERLPYFSLTFGLAGIQNVHNEPCGF